MIEHIDKMSKSELERVYSLLIEQDRRVANNKIATLFPNTGDLRRELYRKHLLFFAAGAHYRQRLFLAGNRIGKTQAALTEIVYHMTGAYPEWWIGKRFTYPQNWWICGKDSNTVKAILQLTLLGPVQEFGTGLIPRDSLDLSTLKDAKKADTPVSIIRVKHVGGSYSSIEFKTYDSGRKSFEGTARCILLDEEPPMAVYTEALLRTMTGDNILMATFTPLQGITEMITAFLGDIDIHAMPLEGSGDTETSKFVINATWDDVPHLSEETKKIILASVPPYQRDARSRGIPVLGSGMIYPISEADILCDSFVIPAHWPRLYALDVGWNRTAAIWLAKNPDTQVIYAYSEHYQGAAEPSVHAQAIKARGTWIPGVIDPAAKGRSQVDGRSLMTMYEELGLKIKPAENGVEAGLYTVWEALSGGRLKVFKEMQNFLKEFRLYRRDEKGHVIKKDDHLMDCLRYCVMGIDGAKTEAQTKSNNYNPGVVSPQYQTKRF